MEPGEARSTRRMLKFAQPSSTICQIDLQDPVAVVFKLHQTQVPTSPIKV